MKKTLFYTASIAALLTFSGCATIMSGDTQSVSVNSNVQDVKFKIDGATYETPAIVTLKRINNDRILRVEDKQCKQVKILRKKVNPWFFGNIIFGTLFPFSSTTDYSKDRMWKYDDKVMINCNK